MFQDDSRTLCCVLLYVSLQTQLVVFCLILDVVAASSSRVSPTTLLIISPSDDVILRALHRYYFLTSSQVCRLLYSPGSHTYVQAKLKALADRGWIQRLFLPRPAAAGSGPRVYTLARAGLNYLKDEGLDVAHRYRPAEHRVHSYLFLSHTLAVNDLLISFELLIRSRPQIRLHQLLHERDLKHRPLKVADAKETITVVPDAWLDLRQLRTRTCLAVEVDQGTVEQKDWRRKVRGLVRSMGGAYQEHFEARSLIVVVLATPGSKRLAELRRWMEAELEELGARDRAQLFRLSDLKPGLCRPDELLLNHVWERPFASERSPLLTLEGGRGEDAA